MKITHHIVGYFCQQIEEVRLDVSQKLPIRILAQNATLALMELEIALMKESLVDTRKENIQCL